MRPLITLFTILLAQLPNMAAAEAVPPTLQYAENFTIEPYDTHTLLTVQLMLGDSERVQRYALVPKEAPLPELPSGIQVVRTPVQRVIVMETVYVGYLDVLGQLDSIVGAATVDFISHPGVRDSVETGRIMPVQNGQSLNIERLMLLQPDMILTSISADPAFDVSPKLIRSGLPVVITAGYMEPHPLGRAEWIRFIAAFFEASEQAGAFFENTALRYETLRQQTATLEARPSVFSGAPYSGTWHVPGGQSFAARMVEHAGGAYLWADNLSQRALPLDTERVFLRAAQADIWLHPSHHRSMDALFAADPRFGKFAAAQEGRIFNNSKQVSAHGGNNIWERGVVHPDEVLADLIHIFHPDILPDHTPIYYERLNRAQSNH
ncbi:MAG: hypothetical protein EA353_07465 [Puniceicoccaceae bacterium]|nr:MAG: hypothetical protein EA353_07465 [Puniceicoccaceae bacterium]